MGARQLVPRRSTDRMPLAFRTLALAAASVFAAAAAGAAHAETAPAAAPSPAAASPATPAIAPPVPALRSYASPNPVGGVESELVAAAKLYGLDPALVKAVAQQESGLRQEARSRVGAIGVMQLMPRTARDLGIDPTDMRQNIRGGVGYLAQLMDQFGGDVQRALAAYNAGAGAVMKHGGIPPFHETRNYVASIMAKAAINAANALTQPLSVSAAQFGDRAVALASQMAGQTAPLAAAVAPAASAAGAAMTTALVQP